MVKKVQSPHDSKKRQNQRIREILRESAKNAEWIPIPEEFHSGDEMGFDIGGISFRGNVVFDNRRVTLNLTAPVANKACEEIWGVGGVEGGPATPRFIDAAKELLAGLCTDWFVLQSRKESIRRRLEAFPEYQKEFWDRERPRIEPLKKRIRELSYSSGENKRRLKRGEISQEEYIENKRPLHDEIVSLLEKAKVENPFMTMFSSEFDDCKYAMDKRRFIESV